MTDLQNLFDEAARVPTERASDARRDEVAAVTVRRAVGRRRVRAASIGLATVLGVTVVSTGAWALTNVDRVSDPAGPDAPLCKSTYPTPFPEDPTAPPLPLASEAPPTGTRVGLYPEATPVTSEVWDAVGEGWVLASYSSKYEPNGAVYAPLAPPFTYSPAVLYLMSPDEQFYEVLELPQDCWPAARVVTWNEEARTARVAGAPGWAMDVNLATGDARPVAFERGDTVSDVVSLVAANAAGDELWQATFGESQSYFRWDRDGGWELASIDQERDAILANHNTGKLVSPSTPDGQLVLFDQPDYPGADDVPEFVFTYDLYTDQTVRADIALPTSAEYCLFADWELKPDSLRYQCSEESGVEYEGWVVPLDGGPATPTDVTGTQLDRDPLVEEGASGAVRWGQPTPRTGQVP